MLALATESKVAEGGEERKNIKGTNCGRPPGETARERRWRSDNKRGQKGSESDPGFLRRFGHELFGGLREESRSRVAVSLGISVNLLRNLAEQSDIDANDFWLIVLHGNQNGHGGCQG